jgi:hypothetical protein
MFREEGDLRVDLMSREKGDRGSIDDDEKSVGLIDDGLSNSSETCHNMDRLRTIRKPPDGLRTMAGVAPDHLSGHQLSCRSTGFGLTALAGRTQPQPFLRLTTLHMPPLTQSHPI